MENNTFLTEQIITYLGNKRSLLKELGKIFDFISKDLKKDKMVCVDLFSGSGIVARYLKQFSSKIIANDLEKYSYIINNCFLSNKEEFNSEEFEFYLNVINEKIAEKPILGIISENYSPKDEKNITINDRCFYTKENAILIDSYRYYIETLVPEKLKKYFLALLITEASIHVNTSGIFKGFYKDKNTGIGKFGGTGENALTRIKGKINIKKPTLSNYSCSYEVRNENALNLAFETEKVDLVYMDPPYNQHPYGSNYFMLNIILENQLPNKISKVSGIPENWNRSPFNQKKEALSSLETIVKNYKTQYFVISYNNEGFISLEEMENMLSKYGTLKTKKIKYNTFRGSRNLNNRNIYTNEFIFILKKEAN